MRIIRHLRELPEPLGASVVTVGNFDGVHLAHQQLLRSVVQAARSTGAIATAITFEPHPLEILAPDRAPNRLTSLSRKLQLIQEQDIDLLLVLPFTKDFSELSPSEFVHSILLGKLSASAIHVGPAFRFGHHRSGGIELLREHARKDGFKLQVLPRLEVRGEPVSSSRIRELLSMGRVSSAGRLLGRPYSTLGPIVPGLGVGKKQTVPTLNLAPVKELLPKEGVYVTRTKLGDHLHESVTNVGHKPTFGQHRLTVESYLLNFEGKVDKSDMEIKFLHRLRDEIKFPDPASLKAQIQKDVCRSRRFFRLLSVFHKRQRRPTVPTSVKV